MLINDCIRLFFTGLFILIYTLFILIHTLLVFINIYTNRKLAMYEKFYYVILRNCIINCNECIYKTNSNMTYTKLYSPFLIGSLHCCKKLHYKEYFQHPNIQSFLQYMLPSFYRQQRQNLFLLVAYLKYSLRHLC